MTEKVMHLTVDLNESDLLLRMRNFEDHMVERKTVKDDKDWKRAAVAFANTAPIGYEPRIWRASPRAVLYPRKISKKFQPGCLFSTRFSGRHVPINLGNMVPTNRSRRVLLRRTAVAGEHTAGVSRPPTSGS